MELVLLAGVALTAYLLVKGKAALTPGIKHWSFVTSWGAISLALLVAAHIPLVQLFAAPLLFSLPVFSTSNEHIEVTFFMFWPRSRFAYVAIGIYCALLSLIIVSSSHLGRRRGKSLSDPRDLAFKEKLIQTLDFLASEEKQFEVGSSDFGCAYQDEFARRWKDAFEANIPRLGSSLTRREIAVLCRFTSELQLVLKEIGKSRMEIRALLSDPRWHRVMNAAKIASMEIQDAA